MGNESNNCENCYFHDRVPNSACVKCYVEDHLSFLTGKMQPGIPSEWLPKDHETLNKTYGIQAIIKEDIENNV